jgi:hypothetical protein
VASPLIEKSHGWFRSWFRKVWDVRGGGLYAVGFALTFLYLEVLDLADDVLGIGALFNGQIVDFIVDFFIDSLGNTIAAFMWPVEILQWEPPFGVIALGVAFWLFPIYAKPHIEKWLFDDEQPDAAATPGTTTDS